MQFPAEPRDRPAVGQPSDRPATTRTAAGQPKEPTFQQIVKTEGVDVFDDAIEQPRRWRQQGLKTALVTSSRNGRLILDAAGITDLFESIVDGVVAAKLNLKGKPDPDIFVAAVRELNVLPERAIVFEDAIAGVQAGQRGRFGLVVGVARGQEQDLADNGADIVVTNLRELEIGEE